ncbi:MAG: hypothetical protein ACRC7O_09150 [Fimbriiglobus sp.]
MRKILGTTVLVVAAGWATAQPPATPAPAPPVAPPAAPAPAPPPPADRYNIAANLGVYPQTTPQAAVASVVRALDKDRAEYLAAQLLDPAFIDARVAERAHVLELGVDRELRIQRDQQRGSPVGERLPYEPVAFDTIVRAEAKQRAFRQVVADIRENLAESPDYLKDLRRFARAGQIVDPGDGTAKLVLKDAPDRSVFFVKQGDRWFVQNPKAEPPAPKPPEAK